MFTLFFLRQQRLGGGSKGRLNKQSKPLKMKSIMPIKQITCCILAVVLFACHRNTRPKTSLIDKNQIKADYTYKEVSKGELRRLFPELFATLDKSLDYYSISSILSEKEPLTNNHFLALQALKEVLAENCQGNKHKNGCNVIYETIEQVFLDAGYNYRIRFKALEYMEYLRKKNFMSSNVRKKLEDLAINSNGDGSKKEGQIKAILFIKKHSIM